MSRKVPLSIIRSFSQYTQQWYMSYRFPDSCQLSANLCDIYHCCVYCEKLLMMDRGNKFEKLVHLVSFTIRVYHDARLPERQKIRGIALMIINLGPSWR